MIIDAHMHLAKDDLKANTLINVYDRLNIDKVVLFGGPQYWGFSGDDAVMEAYYEHPDRIIPLAFVRFGVDPVDLIDRRIEQGFKGFKTAAPRANYDDPSFFPFYDKIEKYNVPILFHLGILMRHPNDPVEDINNNRMRPVYLDTIARAFPKIRIIGAHFGNPWFEEAGMTARWNANIWFDFSGSLFKKKTPEQLRQLLWWDKPGNYYHGHEGKHPFEKVIFGTDVAYERMEDVMNDYRNFCDEVGMEEKYRKKIFGENAAEIFGLIEPEPRTEEVLNPFNI